MITLIKLSSGRFGRRFTALMLTAALVFTAIPFAGAITQADIDKKKAQQAELQDDIDALESSIASLKDRENSALERIELYHQQIDALTGQITASQALLAELDVQIAQTQEELTVAQEKATQYYQLFCQRVRDLEETGTLSYWSILFDAASFADLLDRIHFIRDVVRYDNSMADALDEARQDVADKELQLQTEKGIQEEALADLEYQMEAVEIATVNTEALIVEIQANQEAYADKLQQMEEEADDLAKDIASDEDALAAQKAAEEAAKREEANKNNPSSGGGSSGGGSSTTPPANITGSGLGVDIANYACKFVGVLPYVWGGTSLTHGADCSGFVQAVFKQFGIYLPRTAIEQSKAGYAVSYENAQPGDLIYYRSGASASGSHIGIYIGDGKYVNAVGAKYGTRISYVNTSKPGLTFRRVI